MPNPDPQTSTYTLEGETDYVLPADAAFTNVIGNDQNNTITGNAGNNQLDGGQGADTLRGGLGNDVYVLSDANDVIEGEADGSGVDTVRTNASIDLTLTSQPALAFIEHIFLEGPGNIDATGNELDNNLTGNAGLNHLSGGVGDDVLNGGEGKDTLIGGAGNDTYIVDNTDEHVDEALDEGHDRVFASVSFDLSEDSREGIDDLFLVGTTDLDGTGNGLANRIVGNTGANELYGLDGNDTLEGGDGADTLNGGNNDDTLIGGAGADLLEGGDGDDTYIIDDAGDVIVEGSLTGSGIDTVIVAYQALDYTLAGTNIENVTLDVAGMVTGNDLANILKGSAGDDKLTAGKGNDTLNGGKGVDILIGGEGDDVYYVYNPADSVTEQTGEGADRILSALSNLSLDIAAYANVEHLTLIGTANHNGTGSSIANNLVGNDGNNTLDGLDGNDTLEGGEGADVLKGGAGTDSLVGGRGDDTYVIDADDVLTEAVNQGRDTVQVDFGDYTLLANFEDLTLTGSGGLAGTGNSVANFIRGNGGNNTLIGLDGDDSLMGGAGADRMEGGTGGDLYWVDNAGDAVVEAAGAGFDRVLASTNYTLGANVEYLAFEGTGNFVGTGNALDNTMYGNTGANTLDGGAGRDQLDGGEGNDKLLGGDGDDTITDWKGDDLIDGGAGKDDLRGDVGNDTYLVDALDMVTELAGQGFDTVTASASFALGSLAEVELLLAQAGNGAINLTGSDTANTVTGNDGANQISGQGGDDSLSGGLGNDTIFGGLGSDVLTGGKGRDRFVFDTLPDAKGNLDQILDFKAKDDTFAMENAVFTTLAKKTGTIKASVFHAGKKAHDKDDRVLYDKKTGDIYYDADGTGKIKAVKFATVKKGTFLDYHDFFVI